MWLGTSKVFDAFTFDVRETPYGVMQMHGYPYDANGSTFIVEMHDAVWERPGFRALADELRRRPAVAAARDVGRALDRAGAGDLRRRPRRPRGDGQQLTLDRASRRSATRPGGSGNVVLLGDAAHTAHFSIGSGTKLAMEDALALAACLHEHADATTAGGLEAALAAYEEERRPVVLSTQRAAQASLEWFENLGQYLDQEPMQFAFNIMTRSRRVTYDNLRVRDHEFVEAADRWFADSVRRGGHGPGDVRPPMFQPFRLRELTLTNRVIVSAMDMYSLGRRRRGRLPLRAPGRQGARRRRAGDDGDGLRVPRGPDHAGLRRPLQPTSTSAAFRRITDFVHGQTSTPPSASSSATRVARARRS